MKETIRYLREKYSLSQNQVAAHLDISRQTYIKFESGEAEPSVAQLRLLAALYQVNVVDFIENKFSVQEADDARVSPLNQRIQPQFHHREVLYEIPYDEPLMVSSPAPVYEGVFDGTCVKPLNKNFPADINQKVAITLLDEYVVDKEAILKKLYGMFHHKADPSKWPLEEEAWAMHCVEKYGYLAQERTEKEKKERGETEE